MRAGMGARGRRIRMGRQAPAIKPLLIYGRPLRSLPSSDMRVLLLALLVALVAAEAPPRTLQLSDSVSLIRNDEAEKNDIPKADIVDQTEEFLRTHDLQLDAFGTKVILSPKRIDQGEFNIALKMDEDLEEEGRSKIKKKIKKSKLKKMLVPIAIFVLLKAMTLFPLLIGVLGIKAWNALQLSFGSFVVSFALAVFQLCQKLAGDAQPPPPQPVIAHGGWDARDLAYSAYN